MKRIKLMKVRVQRTNHFPGDNWLKLEVELDNGLFFVPFGLFIKQDRQGRYYANDSTGAVYNTLAEAKKSSNRQGPCSYKTLTD